jgi:transglutaminase-like putative cysteine protease
MIRRISFLVFPALLTAAAGSAQDAEVLHEYFEYAPPQRPIDNTVPVLPEPGSSIAAGLALERNQPDGLTLTPGGPIPSPGFFEDGMGGLRNRPATAEGDATLDRETTPEGMLRYQAVFEPTVSPWKRGAARDTVVFDGAEIALRVSNVEARPVSVAGSAPNGFDPFVGRVRVLADAGEPIALPSVAPDMRFHALRISPVTDATVTRDGADNYYLTVSESGYFDIEISVSAPRFYFGGPLPTSDATPGPTWLPQELAPRARPVLDAAGVIRGMSETEIASRLSVYFGGFEARELAPAETSADAYSDIALSRVGVCRHRAMAFVITAAATGLRARYINNEAHAFVEVYFTGHGYRRIDLGGASEGLETVGGTGATHEREANPLDSGSGVGDGEPYERRHREALESREENAEADLTDPEPPVDEEDHNAAASAEAGRAEAEPTESGSLPTAQQPTLLTAAIGTDRAYRGDTIEVRSTLRTLEDVPIEGAQIEVVISDPSSGYFGVIGTLVTGPDGQAFEALSLPENAPAGRLSIHLRFAGDDLYAPSEVQ